MNRITSLQHPLVKHLVKLRKDRAYRYDQKSALIEGRKLASELKTKVMLTCREESITDPENQILVTPEIIEKISGMRSPEGIVAEVEMAELPMPKLSRLLVLDGINDPGNLGVLFRTALALGWDAVFLLDGCCDPYNDKALTAARGATFKLPFRQGDWSDLEKIIAPYNLKHYVADMKGQDPEKVGDEPLLLILGNEARGPSDESRRRSNAVTIPIDKKMESLNVAVAGGILMYML